jgi:Protein of unknown function (DUF2630)
MRVCHPYRASDHGERNPGREADSRETLLDFLRSAYDAGATVAGWDRDALRSSWSPTPAVREGRWEVEAEMDEPQIHGSIEKLVAEEHELWERESAGETTDADRRRLEEIKISLDQCWDVLRQRRALRDAGKDPEGAQARRPEVVERYQQ